MFDGNKISKLLQIKYPILQGGMAWASDSKLACAVSDAGGLGVIGCGGRQFEWVENEINSAKKTSTGAIGLNFPLEGMDDEEAKNIIEHASKRGISVFTVSGSNRYLRLLPKYGDQNIIIPVIGNVMEAKLAERSGAKAVICEGQESGGSIGRLSLFSLLPQVVDAIKIPVIAAGGIADSRGMRAAFALGAKGIQMGTRFLASEECRVTEEYKKRIIKAKDIDSTVIFNKIKYPARVIKNKFSMEYISKEMNDTNQEDLDALSKGRLRLAVESDANAGALMAGESAGLIHNVKSVRDIIDEIIYGFDVTSNVDIIDKPISKYLKHRPPILLVDEIIELKPGIEAQTSLKLTRDRWFFKCHFPDYAVMPGTLMLEAMSQTMTLAVNSMDKFSGEWEGLLLLSGITNVEFKKEALPEQTLIMTAKIESFKRGVIKGNIKCETDGRIICSCIMTIVIPSVIKQLSEQIRKER